MSLPELGDLEAQCTLLEKIASGYPKESPESEAIEAAARAMHYVCHLDTQEKFRRWVASWNQPPTALQVLQAKLAGIDLPHELLDDTMLEMEQLMDRLSKKVQ